MQSASITTRAAPSVEQTHMAQEKLNAIKTTPTERNVLFAIHDREMYGLEIQQAIAECSGGTESITIGTLYPILHALERKGLVRSRWGDEEDGERGGARRRYYRLTNEGNTAVNSILNFQQKLLNWSKSQET